LKATRADPERDARLVNIAEGMAGRVGTEVPSLWVAPSGGPNALACLTPQPAIVVTREGLDTYTRTELEAVVTYCLVHLRSGDIAWSTLATVAGSLTGSLGLRLAPSSPEAYDIAAAAITRYPPALASALSRSRVQKGRSGMLWFAGEVPGGGRISDRVELLNDL
jgi:Zn-dependent protease with chaperone function